MSWILAMKSRQGKECLKSDAYKPAIRPDGWFLPVPEL